MFNAAEFQRAVTAAPRPRLPEIASLLWRAFAAGHVTEAEAEAVHAAIEARQGLLKTEETPALIVEGGPRVGETAQDRAERPRSRAGSRPRSEASLERRRRWAASGRLPPAIACRFTLAEQAALAVVAAETVKRGDCRLAIGHVAALAGVSETSVRNALREARQLGLVTVEERRASAWRNLTNVVRVVSADWTGWMRLARRSPKPGSGYSTPTPRAGGGCKSAKGTNTKVRIRNRSKPQKPSGQVGSDQNGERRAR